MMSGVVGEVQTAQQESRVSPSVRVDYRSERNTPASTDGSPRGDCKHSSSQQQRQVFPGIAGADEEMGGWVGGVWGHNH